MLPIRPIYSTVSSGGIDSVRNFEIIWIFMKAGGNFVILNIFPFPGTDISSKVISAPEPYYYQFVF